LRTREGVAKRRQNANLRELVLQPQDVHQLRLHLHPVVDTVHIPANKEKNKKKEKKKNPGLYTIQLQISHHFGFTLNSSKHEEESNANVSFNSSTFQVTYPECV
jgi:hypothetical protein